MSFPFANLFISPLVRLKPTSQQALFPHFRSPVRKAIYSKLARSEARKLGSCSAAAAESVPFARSPF